MDETPIDTARCEQVAWIDRVEHLDEAASTSTLALDAARQSNRDETLLFVAERQTAGRGRGGARWWSAPGALAFSVLTQPIDIAEPASARLSLTVGAALCEALVTFEDRVALKWPNDIFIVVGRDAKKLGGVLIESTAATPRRYVIGVGLNVNNPIADAPTEVQTVAASLVDGRLEVLDRTGVLIACLEAIGAGLNRVLANDPTLPDLWRGHSLLTGKQVTVATPQGEVAGQCQGIANDGALLIQTETGIVPCSNGTVIRFG